MKAIFFGTSAFAVPSLVSVAERCDVVAVVTQPDRPSGRGQRPTPTPVKAAALERRLPVYDSVALRALAGDLANLAPDVLAVASYGRILPQAILDLPSSGIAFNVHPSLLPLYRGATPLQSALRDGCSETGVTIIAMDAGMDTGDILLAERTPIGDFETYGMLHDRLAVRGSELLGSAIGLLAGGTLARTPQANLGIDPALIHATSTRPLRKEDLAVSALWPAHRIVDTIRSLAPAPGARMDLGGEPFKILAAREARDGESGVTSDGGFVERAGDGRGVVLLRLTPPNRGALSGAAFFAARAR